MEFSPLEPEDRLRLVTSGPSALPDNASGYLQSLGNRLRFSFTNAASFDLISVDLAEYSTVFPEPLPVRFVGYRYDGTVVSATVTTDGIIDGTGPLADFQTFQLGPEFRELQRCEITTYSWSLDNVVVLRRGPFRVVPWGNWLAQAVVPAAVTNPVAVAAGGNQGGLLNLCLQRNGTLISWGGKLDGQTNVPPGLSNIVAISAGLDHGLGLFTDGTVTGWGAVSCPPEVTNTPPGLTNVVAISAGYRRSLALRSDGTVVEWPTNAVPPGLSNVVAVSAARYQSLALKADGTVVAWGSRDSVTNVPPEATNIVGIAAAEGHNLALRADGRVMAWSATASQSLEVPDGLSNVVAVAAAWGASLALHADGTVTGWGGANGQADVPAGLSNVIAVSAGFAQALALVGDGPPVTAATTFLPRLDAAGFSLTLPTESGRVYRLEYTDGLESREWTALPLVAGRPGDMTLRDTSANGTGRFYRVRRW